MQEEKQRPLWQPTNNMAPAINNEISPIWRIYSCTPAFRLRSLEYLLRRSAGRSSSVLPIYLFQQSSLVRGWIIMIYRWTLVLPFGWIRCIIRALAQIRGFDSSIGPMWILRGSFVFFGIKSGKWWRSWKWRWIILWGSFRKYRALGLFISRLHRRRYSFVVMASFILNELCTNWDFKI